MFTHSSRRKRPRGVPGACERTVRPRRGIALFISMFFVAGIGALALSAIYLTANSDLLARTYEKEDDLKYASEAALQIGKAALNFNPAALPNTSFVALMTNAPVRTADGGTLPGVKVNLFVGPSGSTSGQFGRFASVVAEAREPNGTGFVRRLELTQESFAKYAYWTNSENNASGGTIVFGNGDALWGPVWSNDTITIDNSGATFHDDVGTAAPLVVNAGKGTFVKGYQVKQRPIALPSLGSLSTLSALATVSGYNIPSVTTGNETGVLQRIEFVALDLNGDGDSTDANEGFFRVYKTTSSSNAKWLRGDWPGPSAAASTVENCGDWHDIGGAGKAKFFPAAVHGQSWFKTMLASPYNTSPNGGGNMSSTAATNESNANLQTIMSHPGARCYLGGDPHLVAIARNSSAFTNAQKQKGGDDTTFTANDAKNGSWQQWTGTVPSEFSTRAGWDVAKNYMFPLYRGYNTNTKGVIYANGTIGVSGVVRGVVTLYTPYTLVILDDLRYANDPAAGVCIDILGTISGANTIVANNGVNTPIQIKTSGSGQWWNADDTPGLNLHAVIMALGTSFQVQDYDQAPTNALTCGTSTVGRGCLSLTGGLIQNRRGAVGVVSGAGYVKRYSYDRCAVVNPPPYFPTTGRFQDNRYYELDPVRVNSAKSGAIRELYLSLTGS